MDIEIYKSIEKAYRLAKDEIVAKYSWQELVNFDLKIESIMKYRNDNNCTLSEAKNYVENYINNKKKSHVDL